MRSGIFLSNRASQERFAHVSENLASDLTTLMAADNLRLNTPYCPCPVVQRLGLTTHLWGRLRHVDSSWEVSAFTIGPELRQGRDRAYVKKLTKLEFISCINVDKYVFVSA